MYVHIDTAIVYEFPVGTYIDRLLFLSSFFLFLLLLSERCRLEKWRFAGWHVPFIAIHLSVQCSVINIMQLFPSIPPKQINNAEGQGSLKWLLCLAAVFFRYSRELKETTCEETRRPHDSWTICVTSVLECSNHVRLATSECQRLDCTCLPVSGSLISAL